MDSKLNFQISAGALIFLAALVILLPLQWVGAVLLAVAVHELCHAFAIYLLGGSIECVLISGRGIVMKTQPMSGIREIVSAMAGPLGSLCLLLFVRWLPRTAVCGLVHALYNMIPVLPMDGGRVLHGIIFGLLAPPNAEKLQRWILRGTVFVIILLTILLASKTGIMTITLGICLLQRIHRENSLAKIPFWQYNSHTIHNEVRP